jgi:hypothetical protein
MAIPDVLALYRKVDVGTPVYVHTERWTNRYGRVVGVWPESAQAIRSLALKAFVAAPGVERMLNRAQHTPVIGTERLTPRRAAAGVR